MAELGNISKNILREHGHEVSDTPVADNVVPASAVPEVAPSPEGSAIQSGEGGEGQAEFVETQEKQEIVAQEPGVVVINDMSVNTPAEGEQPAAPAPHQPSEADILRIVSERLGREITSFDDLTPVQPERVLSEEEKQQDQERLRNEAVAYGINNKLFTRQELETYATDKARSPRDIAFELFSADMKGRQPGITDAELEEHFASWSYEHEEEGHPLRTMRAEEMAQIHSNYIGNKYSSIQMIDQRYAQDQQILSEGREYGATIDKLFGKLTDGTNAYEMTFAVGDLGEYKYDVSAATINEIKNHYLSADTFRALGSNAKNEPALTEMIKNALIVKELPKIIHRVAEAHKAKALLQLAADKQGVKPQREIEASAEVVPRTLGAHSAAILDSRRN